MDLLWRKAVFQFGDPAAITDCPFLWLGSILVVDQELTPGALMVFYSLVGYVISPIGSLISSNQTIQDALIAADRLFQIMDLEREQDNNQKIILEPDMVGDITFENVSFRYWFAQGCVQGIGLEDRKGEDYCHSGRKRVGQDDFDFVVTAYLSYTGGSHSHRRL